MFPDENKQLLKKIKATTSAYSGWESYDKTGKVSP